MALLCESNLRDLSIRKFPSTPHSVSPATSDLLTGKNVKIVLWKMPGKINL